MSNNIKLFAKNLRRNQTDTEKLLWSELRRRQINGVKFRRQQIIDRYIVDFICFERKLIIELDGGQHNEENNRQKDIQRTSHLNRCGYTVLRFWDHEVFESLEAVLAVVDQTINHHPHPHPPPSRGRGTVQHLVPAPPAGEG